MKLRSNGKNVGIVRYDFISAKQARRWGEEQVLNK